MVIWIYSFCICLNRWNDWDSELTVDLDERTNVGNLHLAPGFNKYRLFLQAAGVEDEDTNPITMPPNEVTDDEKSLDEQHPDEEDDWNDGWNIDSEGDDLQQSAPRDIDFSLRPDDQAMSEAPINIDEEHAALN